MEAGAVAVAGGFKIDMSSKSGWMALMLAGAPTGGAGASATLVCWGSEGSRLILLLVVAWPDDSLKATIVASNAAPA